MAPARILILTASHLSRNPRVVKEATALGAAGHDVTVMTVSVQARFERMDLELIAPLPFKRVVIDYASTSLRCRLADFYQRSSTFAARWARSTFGLEFARSLGPAESLLRFARSHPADLTIVHTEIPVWAAQYLIRDGRRVAVDIEDWYSEDLLFADRQSRPIRLLRHAESFALNHCAYSSATSESMSAGLAEAYRCAAPLVVRNTFPLQKTCRLDRPPVPTSPSFIWFSQTIGPGRGLELFFAAWVKTQNPSRVYLLGDERPGYRAQLLSRLPPSRRSDVHFIPLVTPEQLPLTLAEFDLGLALEPQWPRNRDVTISNKIFQYMNAGLALVATDTAGQSEVMRAAPDSGLLITPHETTEFAHRLDTLLGDPARLRAMQAASRAAAEHRFCWEHEAPVVVGAVNRALAQPPP